MHERRLNAFTSEPRVLGDALKLGLALDLKSRWAGVLAEPIPKRLQRLVDELDHRIRRRPHSGG
jgi:hypothetical protein